MSFPCPQGLLNMAADVCKKHAERTWPCPRDAGHVPRRAGQIGQWSAIHLNTSHVTTWYHMVSHVITPYFPLFFYERILPAAMPGQRARARSVMPVGDGVLDRDLQGLVGLRWDHLPVHEGVPDAG